ncbi:unnamed protein product [Paramecium pentaurelia]|uniref:CBS domain-containing protein n=1 Tax=Paramecium pentaurelia TaxID=43138 RepID=A0A8S1SC01_9CILI|nr:unnamed protein product [Paramecium pentaurelia]
MISLYYNKLSINCLIFFSGFCSGATQEAKLRYGNEKEQNMEIHILLSTLLENINLEQHPSLYLRESLQFQFYIQFAFPLVCTKNKRYHLEYIQQLMKICKQQDVIKPEKLKIIVSVMELRNKFMINLIKPIHQVCYIQQDEPICKSIIRKLKLKEYSMIPIIENNCVIGLFKSKDLILDNLQQNQFRYQLTFDNIR